MRRYFAAIVTILLIGAANAVCATEVNFKIEVTQKFKESLLAKGEKTKLDFGSGYWNEPNGVVQVELPRVDPTRDLGVILLQEGAPERGPDEIITVNVQTGSLEKNIVVVQPGSRVKFFNVDPYDHELYSPNLENFGPERLAPNSFRPVDFAKEGVYEIRCRRFPHFKGWIVAIQSTMVLKLDQAGTATIEDLVPGKYTVKIFLKGEIVHEQSFEIEKERELQVALKIDNAQTAVDAPKETDLTKDKVDSEKKVE